MKKQSPLIMPVVTLEKQIAASEKRILLLQSKINGMQDTIRKLLKSLEEQNRLLAAKEAQIKSLESTMRVLEANSSWTGYFKKIGQWLNPLIGIQPYYLKIRDITFPFGSHRRELAKKIKVNLLGR